jgi:hypothetical protein
MRNRGSGFICRSVLAVLAFSVGSALDGAAWSASECTCRYAGASYDLDSCVCIATPGGAERACCGLVLNNTSWRFTGDSCPAASVAPRQSSTRDALAQVPSSPNDRVPRNDLAAVD